MANMEVVVWYNRQYMPVEEAYDAIMRQIGVGTDKPEAAVMAARDSVFGHNCLVAASDEYHELSTQRELGYTLADWHKLTRSERAKLLAHFRLHNMVEAVNAYLRHEDSVKQRERAEQKRATTPSRVPARNRGIRR